MTRQHTRTLTLSSESFILWLYLSVCWRRGCSVSWLHCVSVRAQQGEAAFYRLIACAADDIITATLAKRQELNGAKHLVPDAPLPTPHNKNLMPVLHVESRAKAVYVLCDCVCICVRCHRRSLITWLTFLSRFQTFTSDQTLNAALWHQSPTKEAQIIWSLESLKDLKMIWDLWLLIAHCFGKSERSLRAQDFFPICSAFNLVAFYGKQLRY